MTKNISKQFILKLIICSVSLLSFSCRKEDPTTAKIKVLATDGAVVSEAQVILYATSTTTPQKTPIIRDTLYSNGIGEVIFDLSDHYNLGQAGVAVLDIKVTKEDNLGTGIIKITEEKMNEETVIIQ